MHPVLLLVVLFIEIVGSLFIMVVQHWYCSTRVGLWIFDCLSHFIIVAHHRDVETGDFLNVEIRSRNVL